MYLTGTPLRVTFIKVEAPERRTMSPETEKVWLCPACNTASQLMVPPTVVDCATQHGAVAETTTV